MSHTTTIKSVPIRDVNALKAAVADLQKAGVKCQLKEGGKPRMWYSDQYDRSYGGKDAAYVLKLEGRMDIGFTREADGSLSMAYDNHQNAVSQYLGGRGPLAKDATPDEVKAQEVGLLVQYYGKNVAVNQLRNEGHMIESADFDKNGNLVVVAAVR